MVRIFACQELLNKLKIVARGNKIQVRLVEIGRRRAEAMSSIPALLPIQVPLKLIVSCMMISATS